MYDLIITGANVVIDNGTVPLTVAVKNGKIAALFEATEQPAAEKVLNYPGKIILPGALDSHSHVTYCGDFASGTKTAASGGVTTIVEMPLSLTLPPATTKKEFDARVQLIEQEAYSDVALWGGTQPDSLDNLDALDFAGACAYKVFTNYVGEEYQYFNDYALLRLMKKLEKLGGVVGVHAENESICAGLVKECKQQKREAEFHPVSRPPISEYEAVSRVCMAALETGCRTHFCHISTPESVEIIHQARAKGAKITLETCPQYLVLTQEEVARSGNYGKCNPPIRDDDRQRKLWEALLHGYIDCIGSDHSAYSEQQKEIGDFWSAPGGFPGMDLMLPALISEGVLKRGLSWSALAHITATNTADIFGLSHCKGAIRIGLDADFAVVDPEKEWTYHADNTFYHTKSKHYPYEGRQFKGAIISTIVRGEVVYCDGEICVEKGYGKFIPQKREL